MDDSAFSTGQRAPDAKLSTAHLENAEHRKVWLPRTEGFECLDHILNSHLCFAIIYLKKLKLVQGLFYFSSSLKKLMKHSFSALTDLRMAESQSENGVCVCVPPTPAPAWALWLVGLSLKNMHVQLTRNDMSVWVNGAFAALW